MSKEVSTIDLVNSSQEQIHQAFLSAQFGRKVRDNDIKTPSDDRVYLEALETNKLQMIPNTLSVADAVSLSDEKEITSIRKISTLPERDHKFLKDSGFNVWDEIGRVVLNYYKYKKEGLSQTEIEQRIREEVKGNILGFKYEYLMQLSFFPIPVEQKVINGQKRLVSQYGGRLLVDTIDIRERHGLVHRALGCIDEFLSTAKPGEGGIYFSVQGESNLKKLDGEKIIYKDEQDYIYLNNTQGILEANTVISDMTPEQSALVLEKVRRRSQILRTDPLSILREIPDRTALVHTSDNPLTFHQFLDCIQEVIGTDVIRVYKNSKGEEQKVTFQEVHNTIDRRDELLKVDTFTDTLITTLNTQSEFLSPKFKLAMWDIVNNIPDLDRMEKEEAIKVLSIKVQEYGVIIDTADKLCVLLGDLYDEIHGLNKKDIASSIKGGSHRNRYRAIRSIGGCNGGGNQWRIVWTPLGPRYVSDGEHKWYVCPNPQCKYKANGPIGNQCPNCGLTKEEYAKMGGQIC